MYTKRTPKNNDADARNAIFKAFRSSADSRLREALTPLARELRRRDQIEGGRQMVSSARELVTRFHGEHPGIPAIVYVIPRLERTLIDAEESPSTEHDIQMSHWECDLVARLHELRRALVRSGDEHQESFAIIDRLVARAWTRDRWEDVLRAVWPLIHPEDVPSVPNRQQPAKLADRLVKGAKWWPVVEVVRDLWGWLSGMLRAQYRQVGAPGAFGSTRRRNVTRVSTARTSSLPCDIRPAFGPDSQFRPRSCTPTTTGTAC